MNSEILPKSITVPIIINYYECNIDSIWISIIIVIIMIFFLIFLKVILYSYIYKIHRVCHPIPFLFGEHNSCKQIIYSIKSQQLKRIAEEKSRDEKKARDEEKAREQQQNIIDQITTHNIKETEEKKARDEEKKRIEHIQKQKENENCDSIGEDFTNQYTRSERLIIQEGLQLQYIPVYILAMYKRININIVDVIEKMKNILYIVFNEYIYPKIYRITHS